MPPPLAIKADARSFPTPFKCSGDFCGLALQLSQADRLGGRRAAAPPPQAAAASALSLLFTKEELGALGDSNVHRLVAAMEVAQSTSKSSELRVLAYKSIALGRGNREHLDKANTSFKTR